MADKKLSPTACQNVITGTLNNIGINQFHNNIRGIPNNRVVKIMIAKNAKISFIFFLFVCLDKCTRVVLTTLVRKI